VAKQLAHGCPWFATLMLFVVVIRVLQQELLESREIVGVDQVYFGIQELLPDSVALRSDIWRGPEAHAAPLLVGCLHDVVQLLPFGVWNVPAASPREVIGPFVADQRDERCGPP
jgi:hypothetical protein